MNYMGSAISLTALYNHGTFQQHDYGAARISRTSTLQKQYSGTDTPSWTDTLIKMHELIDEVDIVQVGQVSDETFERIEYYQPEASRLSKWPTRENPKIYKFSTFWVSHHPSMTSIERKTYSGLDWLGDVGGLFEGLFVIGSFFISPIAYFAMKLHLFVHSQQQFSRDGDQKYVCCKFV